MLPSSKHTGESRERKSATMNKDQSQSYLKQTRCLTCTRRIQNDCRERNSMAMGRRMKMDHAYFLSVHESRAEASCKLVDLCYVKQQVDSSNIHSMATGEHGRHSTHHFLSVYKACTHKLLEVLMHLR